MGDPAATEYGPLMKELQQKLKDHAAYVWEHGEDMPEIKNWEWKDKGDHKTRKAEESEGQQGSIDSFHCEDGEWSCSSIACGRGAFLGIPPAWVVGIHCPA